MSFDEARAPKLLIFAGPNGSGKSTVTKTIRPVGLYVNADEIKKMLDCSDLEAAQAAEATRRRILESRKDFTFETVLSSPQKIEFIAEARAAGYHIQVIFVLTKSSAINVERVKDRVRKGGHPVPEDKIISRFKRSLGNIPALTQLAHRLIVFDNTGESPIAICEVNGETATVVECENWSKREIIDLLTGADCPN